MREVVCHSFRPSFPKRHFLVIFRPCHVWVSQGMGGCQTNTVRLKLFFFFFLFWTFHIKVIPLLPAPPVIGIQACLSHKYQDCNAVLTDMLCNKVVKIHILFGREFLNVPTKELRNVHCLQSPDFLKIFEDMICSLF